MCSTRNMGERGVCLFIGAEAKNKKVVTFL